MDLPWPEPGAVIRAAWASPRIIEVVISPHGYENGGAVDLGGGQALAIEPLQGTGHQHAVSRPPARLAVGIEQQQVVAPARRQVEIVQAHHHRAALGGLANRKSTRLNSSHV